MGEELWINVDEAEDVAASVRHALLCFEATSVDEHAWKWLILALHAAIQGACVCHLVTTCAPVGAVTERNAGEWLSYHEARRNDPNAVPPRTYLMSLPELLKAIRKPYSAGDRSNVVGVTLTESELAWIARVHDDIRNQFVHFAPLGWSIDVSGVPDLAKLIARVVREIADFGWAFRHSEQAWKVALSNDLKRLEALA